MNKLPDIEDVLIAYGVHHPEDELEKADIIALVKEYAKMVIDRCAEVAELEGGYAVAKVDKDSILSVKKELI